MTGDVRKGEIDCGSIVARPVSKRQLVNFRAAGEDRISYLPIELITHILLYLPTHDVARTSILSKFWRNIWCTYPYLILDSQFYSQLTSKKEKSTHRSEFTKVFNMILAVHTGPILYFRLYIAPMIRYCSIQLWIDQLSDKGLRTIDFVFADKVIYYLPSALFACPELKLLRLYNWVVGPPVISGSFASLTSVQLYHTSIVLDMTFGTQLKNLHLRGCRGIERLARQFTNGNNLRSLCIETSTKIEWQWLQCTRKLELLGLVLTAANSNIMKVNKLIELLSKIPIFSQLYLDGPTLEVLGPPPSDVTRPTIKAVNLRTLTLFGIKLYKLCQISNVVYLIRSFPNLQHLCIVLTVDKVKDLNPTDLIDEHYWGSLDWKDMFLDQLQTVKIKGAVLRRYSLHFIKHLLAYSPSLKVISLFWKNKINDPIVKLRIKQELQQFPKLSLDANIIWC